MAISPEIENGPFIGNGTQAAFAFTFTAITPAEVAVLVDGVVQPGGYTVALGEGGGTVTFAAPPASGAQIILRSNPDFVQDSVFENEGAYNLATVNLINRRHAVRALVTKKRLDATSVAAANASASAAVAAATTATGAASASAASATSAAGSAAAAGASAGSAAGSASAAANAVGNVVLAAATSGAYPNSAASNVPRGLTQASVGAITGGSGGANGTFALTWSGGNFNVNPTGNFTVSGGAVTAVSITGPGLYIGGAPSVPTPGFAASSGLTGAAVTLTAQFLVQGGQGYWVQSADGNQLDRYTNVGGVATAASGVGPVPLVVNPPYPNATMQRWLTLVAMAGSGVSSAAQTALRNFEYQLRQMELARYFVRLNVFLGNGAAAARIPFVQRAGIGYSTDAGTMATWIEANGLVGATLDTGVTLAAAGLNVYNVLFGCYNLADPNAAGSDFVVGNAAGAWGLHPDITGSPTTTDAKLFAWDYAGRINGTTARVTTGPTSSGAITKGPMSGYRKPDGTAGIMLCGYPLLDGNYAARPLYPDPNNTIPEPSGNVQVKALSTWPIGGYWIADAMPEAALAAFHRIYHDMQVAAGRGVVTEGY